IATTTQVVLPLGQIHRAPEPYCTLALSGHEWVMELIIGYLKCIHCELGMYVHVFESLINELHAFCNNALGHTDSRYVLLEEQLAIFLYSCVTGLT
ncbi:hypothetical protein BDR04DRAFT_983810, partial [Suillus decipiens]